MINREKLIKMLRDFFPLFPIENKSFTANDIINFTESIIAAERSEHKMITDRCEKLEQDLITAWEIIQETPEINMRNYNENDVEDLNNGTIKIYSILRDLIEEKNKS